MADDTPAGQDIRMQRDMWAAFCTLTKWSVIGLVVFLFLMWVFVV